MKHFILAITLFFVSGSLLADIEYFTGLNSVYYRGEHELAGNFGFKVQGNHFPDASSDRPVFMEILFGNGVSLSHTLVDQTSDDPTLNQPVFLPLWMDSVDGSSFVGVAAPPETLSIVRWVKGENTLWLRISAPSSEWIAFENGVGSPTSDIPVYTSLGISASAYWDLLKEKHRNLPFPSRNVRTNDSAFHDAISTLFCLDLSRSKVEPSGINSVIPYGGLFFDSEAELEPGVFQRSTQLPVDQVGTWRIARGEDRVLGVDVSSNVKTPGACPERKSRNTLSTELFREGPLNPFLKIHNGSMVSLQTPPDSTYGFEPEDVLFNSPGISLGVVEVDPDSSFVLNDTVLYRSVHLIWNAGSWSLDHLDLGLDVTLQYDCSQPPPDMFVHYQWALADYPEPGDEPPFNGAHQQKGCEQTLVRAGSGVWRHGSMPDSGMMAHLTRPGQGFRTQIIVANTGEEAQAYQLYPYASEGRALPAVTGNIEPGFTWTVDAPELLAGANASHFRFDSHEEVLFTAVYQADHANGTPAHVSANHLESRRWRIYPGNDAIGWDGVAFINGGATPAVVVVSLMDFNGEVVEEIPLDALNPSAKQLVVLSGLFSRTAAYYEIKGSESLSIVSLRGDFSGRYLWENRAIALPELDPSE